MAYPCKYCDMFAMIGRKRNACISMGNVYEYVHSGSFNMEQENQGFQIRHALV